MSVSTPSGGHRWSELTVAAIAMAALLSVMYFDLATALPLNDEFFYRWSAAGLGSGRGLHLWPSALPPALPQMLAAAAVRLTTADPRWMRLAVLPFVAVQVYFSYRLAARLGADRFWSAVAAVAIAVHPLALSVATGLMSDPAYLALLTAAAWFGMTWIEEARGHTGALLLTMLAILERQHGLGIPLALAAALLLSRRRRPLTRGDLAGLGFLAVAAVAALEAPYVLGLASAHMQLLRSPGNLVPSAGNVVGTLIAGPVMAGLLLLPFALALWRRPASEDQHRGRADLVPLTMAVIAVIGAATFAIYFGTMIYPGDQFGNWGMGPLHMGGNKPSLIPTPAFLALELVTTASAVVVLGRRRRLWIPSALTPTDVFLVLLALSQLLPMLNTSSTDRYHLAVAAPLIPLLAARAAAGASRAGAVAAVVALALGVTYFVVAEQDYQAWQAARDVAARQAFDLYGADRVAAGYEANGTYVAIPAVDRTGRLPAGLEPATMLPHRPVATLYFAASGDPRPGVDYRSAAPGRIVIGVPPP